MWQGINIIDNCLKTGVPLSKAIEVFYTKNILSVYFGHDEAKKMVSNISFNTMPVIHWHTMAQFDDLKQDYKTQMCKWQVKSLCHANTCIYFYLLRRVVKNKAIL